MLNLRLARCVFVLALEWAAIACLRWALALPLVPAAHSLVGRRREPAARHFVHASQKSHP